MKPITSQQKETFNRYVIRIIDNRSPKDIAQLAQRVEKVKP